MPHACEFLHYSWVLLIAKSACSRGKLIISSQVMLACRAKCDFSGEFFPIARKRPVTGTQSAIYKGPQALSVITSKISYVTNIYFQCERNANTHATVQKNIPGQSRWIGRQTLENRKLYVFTYWSQNGQLKLCTFLHQNDRPPI